MVFLTGGTGLVGMHLLASLRAEGKMVRALKRESSDLAAIKAFFDYSFPSKPEAFDGIEWVDGELLDVPLLASYMEGCDEVYHAAAMVSFHPKDHKQMLEVNVEGTANMVNLALAQGVKRFGYVSSVAALGRDDKASITEDTEWKYDSKNSTYAGSKYNSELEVWRGIEEGLNAYMVNPGIILGIGDFKRSSAELFLQMHKGFPYYPGGHNGFVAVGDVVRVLRKMMDEGAPSRRYLLVHENWSYELLFQKVAASLKTTAPKKVAPLWLMKAFQRLQQVTEFFTGKRAFVTKESVRNSNQNYSYDASKVKKELKFEFQNLDEVIEETGAYFMSIH